jgi:glutathione S-transferase
MSGGVGPTCLVREADLKVDIASQGLREENSILRWLADTHGLSNWYPNEPISRANIDRVLDWSVCELYPAARLGRDPEERKTLDALLDKIETFFLKDNKFVGGSAVPTIADLSFRPGLALLCEASFLPRTQAYIERFDIAVPSYRIVSVPDARAVFASWSYQAKSLNWDVKTVSAAAPVVEVFQHGRHHYRGCPNDTEALYMSKECQCRSMVEVHSKFLAEKAVVSKGRNLTQQATIYLCDTPNSQAVDCLLKEGRVRLRQKLAPSSADVSLDVGGVKLQELSAILRWLADTYHLSQWYPSDPVQRANIDRVLDWRQCDLYPTVMKKEELKEGLQSQLDKLETYFLKDDKFLGGNSAPTIADLAVRPLLTEGKLQPKTQAYVERFDAYVLNYSGSSSSSSPASSSAEVNVRKHARELPTLGKEPAKKSRGAPGEAKGLAEVQEEVFSACNEIETRLWQHLGHRQDKILHNLDSLLQLFHALAGHPSSVDDLLGHEEHDKKRGPSGGSPDSGKRQKAQIDSKEAKPAQKKEVPQTAVASKPVPDSKAVSKPTAESKAALNPEVKAVALEITASTPYAQFFPDRFEGNVITHITKLAMASNPKFVGMPYKIVGYVAQAPFYAVKLALGSQVVHLLLTRPAPTDGKVSTLATSEGDHPTVPASLLSRQK